MARVATNLSLFTTARDAIALAPGWARVGLTFGNQSMREAALNELAASIASRIEHPPAEIDPAQLRLAL